MPINRELIAIIESNDALDTIVARVKKLLESNTSISLNETYDDDIRKGHTPFSWAVVNNNIPLARALFNLGVATNIHPENVNLAQKLNEQIQKVLERGEAYPNEKEILLSLQKDILFSLLNPNLFATANVFKPYKCTNLMAHLVSENYSIVKAMIANNLNTVKPNIQDIEGKTVLTLAAKMNRTDMVKYLLQMLPEKMDVNLPDVEGNTPLHYAFAYGNKEMITALLAHGANNNITNVQGLKPSDMIETPKEKIVQLLKSVAINAKRDINALDNDPPYYLPGKHMMDDDENAVNSWQYLESVLQTNPPPDEITAAIILGLKSNYAGVSIIDEIMKNKSNPKPLLELLTTVKRLPTTPKAPIIHRFLAEGQKAQDLKPALELKNTAESQSMNELPESGALALINSVLYASDLKMKFDDSGKEILVFKLDNKDDMPHYVKKYSASVVDEENGIVMLPKDAALAVLKGDGVESFEGKPIWDALKEEMGLSSRVMAKKK